MLGGFCTLAMPEAMLTLLSQTKKTKQKKPPGKDNLTEGKMATAHHETLTTLFGSSACALAYPCPTKTRELGSSERAQTSFH